MKALLVAINAKFSHTNLAVRAISAYVKMPDVSLPYTEHTINQSRREILNSLYDADADVYLFSCYIWNINMVRELVSELRAVRTGSVIVLGGPEVTWNAEEILRDLPAVDYVVRGEGEKTIHTLLSCLRKGNKVDCCEGITYRLGDKIIHTPDRELLPMNTLPFPYGSDERLENRVIYYESMRGCPFQCSYCLSSIETGVRTRYLPTVLGELSWLLQQRVMQVKFVDRTFNFDTGRACDIWRYLIAHDNGVTGFHFELAGDLLDEASISILEEARPGLFELEIGVQSTCSETLDAIHRKCDFNTLFNAVKRLRSNGNVHIHLDLIAGLPFEDYHRFASSFNDVYKLRPHQLQLGFLKVLRGSRMEREKELFGIVCQNNAPYEAFSTNWIEFDKMNRLRQVAQAVDIYHNSSRFGATVDYLCRYFPDPFTFFDALALSYADATKQGPISKTGYYDLLGLFMDQQGIARSEYVQWLCRYDILTHEKPRRMPNWVTMDSRPLFQQKIRAFFEDESKRERYLPGYIGEDYARLERIVHLEVFPFDPRNGQDGETALLFDYAVRDVQGLAFVEKIPL